MKQKQNKVMSFILVTWIVATKHMGSFRRTLSCVPHCSQLKRPNKDEVNEASPRPACGSWGRPQAFRHQHWGKTLPDQTPLSSVSSSVSWDRVINSQASEV